MAKNLPSQPKPDLEAKVNQILAQEQITVAEHLELVNFFLSDHLITNEERFYLNRVFDELKLGHLTILC